MRLLLATALVACVSVPGVAQVVRGTVRDAISGRPVAGVLIELRSVDSAAVVRASLSRPDGTFALRALPGSFRLSAKRIGIRRVVTPVIALGPGETLTRDIVVDAIPTVLARVDVDGLAFCTTDQADGERIAALWEDAVTALRAVGLSLRDTLYEAETIRFVRAIDARGTRTNESRARVTGRLERPFGGPDPEEVGRTGYRTEDTDGRVSFRALDVETLVSGEFRHTHCLTRAARRERQLTGVSFVPLRATGRVEVAGTVWLDERSRELRRVEYRYVAVPDADSARIGGTLEFVRLPNGAWIMQRWSVRVPAASRPLMPVEARSERSAWVLPRPQLQMLREEGGELVSVKPRTASDSNR